jgi:hypothetical protein
MRRPTARIEHAWSIGFERYITNASSAAGAEIRRVFEADFDNVDCATAIKPHR